MPNKLGQVHLAKSMLHNNYDSEGCGGCVSYLSAATMHAVYMPVLGAQKGCKHKSMPGAVLGS